VRDTDKHSGKKVAFFSGVLLGSVAGAAAVYFTAVSSGRKSFIRIQDTGRTMINKAAGLYKKARKRPINLKGESEHQEQVQGIPIPRDYV
jgi:hypothetical protein